MYYRGDDDMSISIRMNDKELELIKKYAELNGSTVSEVMRKAILEKIEDEFDIFLYEKAFKAYEQNSRTYTIEEAKSLLGIK
jgi:RHH-type transcriptional regulator, rel operon repressor / antitoxin RelB